MDLRLFYPGAAQLAPQCVCGELPVSNSISQTVAAGSREVAYLLSIGKSRVKNTANEGAREGGNEPTFCRSELSCIYTEEGWGQGGNGLLGLT